MFEVHYYKSTYKEWLKDYAKALAEATGEKAEVRGNSLIFPPGWASGRYEFYEVGDGLALLLIDYTLLRPTKFTSVGAPGNDNYIISYFLSKSIKFESEGGRHIDVNNKVLHAAYFTSQALVVTYDLKPNERVKGLQLIFNRGWALKNLSDNSIPINLKKIKPFVAGHPIQVLSSYDHKTEALIDEIFNNDTPLISKVYLMEGYACKLAALFFNDLIEKGPGQKYEQSEDVIQVFKLKEHIEQNLTNIPAVADAAKTCLMSESKFLQLFKALFETNYSTFFIDKRMKKAKVLLKQGKTVTNTAYLVGYGEVASFSKAFKQKFGIGPREYVKTNHSK